MGDIGIYIGGLTIVAHNKQPIAFVILHYIADDLTRNCIESIMKLESDTYESVCVVIDNGSNNGSFERLKDLFVNEHKVFFLDNETNIGFSEANNRAFKFAQEHIAPKHVVIINNDTVIRQNDFLDQLASIAEETNCHILGPDIYVERKGIHQNPILNSIPPLKKVEQSLKKLEDSEKSSVFEKIESNIKTKIKKVLSLFPFGRSILTRNQPDWTQPAVGKVLHGAALIFTSRFLSNQELPFDPQTFLYQEENILAIRCKRNAWICFYSPKLQVIHFDDGATDILTETKEAKSAFLRKHEIDSHKILLDYYLRQTTFTLD